MYKILIVDDEKDVRNLVKRALERENYEVTESPSGDEALPIVNEKDFDLYITDLKMPGKIDGIGLVKMIRAKNPESAVLVISGYLENYLTENEELIKKCNFIQKPFSLKFLIEKVKEIISARL